MWKSLVLVLTLLSGCSRGTKVLDQVIHDTVRFDIQGFDPALIQNATSSKVLPSIYETLYQYAYVSDSLQVLPLLADGMPKLSSDGLTVTIPLKKGVRFSDDPCFRETHGQGRELTAQDFVYSFKRLASPRISTDNWWMFDGKLVGINEFHDRVVKASKEELQQVLDLPVDGLVAKDRYTLQLKLTAPYPQLVYILTMFPTSPVPREAVADYGAETGLLTEHPVGTGPYVLKSWERRHRITLGRNLGYRKEFAPGNPSGPLPLNDGVEFRVMAEDQPLWLEFLKGDLDLISVPKYAVGSAFSDTNQVSLTPQMSAQGIHSYLEPAFVMMYIAINMNDPVLGKNKLLRQALSSAVDRSKWIRVVEGGVGSKMEALVPAGVPYRPEHPQIKYDFDLSRAKNLLAKAGYPGGKGLPVFDLELGESNTESRQRSEFLAQQFAQIGVNVYPKFTTGAQYLNLRAHGQFQIFTDGWRMDYPDAQNAYLILYGPSRSPGPNASSFNHPEFNALYEKLARTSDPVQRKALNRKMDQIVQEEVPLIFGFYPKKFVLSQKRIGDFRPNGMIRNFYKYLKVDR